uniref:Uncharacterized protein n=1 Tax=Anguilla anguilla TaxID=7936 RepID=A0A0E9RN32_ANGAN
MKTMILSGKMLILRNAISTNFGYFCHYIYGEKTAINASAFLFNMVTQWTECRPISCPSQSG